MIAFIVQARMTSTRLPGKVMRPVLGKPLLEYQIERLSKVPDIDKIIIATTSNDTDQPIIDFCVSRGLSFFRGSETDVLSRYYGAAVQYGVSTIIRVTSDCPVIDPEVLTDLIRLFRSEPNIDYASNTLERSFPRGLDAEIFTFTALENAQMNATTSFQREHVTPYFYQNPHLFALKSLKCAHDYSAFRLTVDTAEDLQLITELITEMYPHKPAFGLEDIIELFRRRPELANINSHVEQKKN